MENHCPRCGSDEIIPHLRVADESPMGGYRSREHVIEADAHPDALIFKDTVSVRISASVCGNCGHVELRADDYRGLYVAYRQAMRGEQS